MASTIKVDKIEGSTGSTVTVPTGQTFTITDGISGTGANLTALNATQITSGTIPSADRLPTVTVAKGGTNLSSFSAGDVLYATGATTLAKLAAGTGSDTLKMNSGGTAPEWVTVAPASSDYVKISTQTISSDIDYVSFDGDFSSDYSYYVLYIYNWRPKVNSSARLRFRQSDSIVSSSLYRYVGIQNYSDTTPTNLASPFGAWNTNYAQLTAGDLIGTSAASGGWNGTVEFFQPLSTVFNKAYKSSLWASASGSGTDYYSQIFTAAGQIGDVTAISGFSLYANAGDTQTGTFTLYGVK